MRVNEVTALVSDKLVLVPYSKHHVERYHEWMSSAELQELTASEPLTLEEEFAMQRSWHQDKDKLTFIVLERPSTLTDDTKSFIETAEDIMIGDVNLFLSPLEDSEDAAMQPEAIQAECEIMIASSAHRRQGHALTALILMLSYANTSLEDRPVEYFARIGQDNQSSIALFEKLGFTQQSEANVFGEIEFRMKRDGLERWSSFRTAHRALSYSFSG